MSNDSRTLLRLAIQKSGRLHEDSVALLSECGISFSFGKADSKLRSEAANFPIEIVFLRDDDIPRYVADGVADLGIVGENVLLESGKQVGVVERLGFSKCRLAIAVPKGSACEGICDLEGANIATSYPTLLKGYLQRAGVSAKIHEIRGSVEVAPGLGLAEAICDIVASGSTLLMNGLREVETVLRSEAVLIGGTFSKEKEEILNKLCFRIRAVRKASESKYVVLNAPNEALESIIAVLPGMKSPTVVPLALKGWSAVHSVLAEDEFWEIIENLKAAGAQGILVVPIEKMIL